MKLGISGRLTRATISSPLTPLMLLAAILVGIIALFSIPREEEPQISVPMVDMMNKNRMMGFSMGIVSRISRAWAGTPSIRACS